MRVNLIKKFKEIYHEENVENIHSFFAPGRVNLIGEHTDYNGGHVFPCALTFGTYLLVRMRDDNKLNFISLNFERFGVLTSSIDDVVYRESNNWTNYCLGVIDEFNKSGHKIDKGMDILIYGTVPNGSGLSSSASLEVVTGGMLRQMFHFEDLTDIDLALLGQKAENNFCKTNCGIMDQFASANGRKNCAIFLDCATLKYEYAPLNMNGYKILIVNTNKKHSLNTSAYNDRRRECEHAFELLHEHNPDKKSLGDFSIEEFERDKHYITDEVELRRAKHAVYENQRTLKAIEALRNDDLVEFGHLMDQSGDSLRYDFEVTCKELDVLVDLARKQPGVIGSRMTGGGFGGCTVNLVREDCVDSFIKEVGEAYQKEIGYAASFYIADAGDGVKSISADSYIKRLVNYGIVNHMIEREDEVYVTNLLLKDLNKNSYNDEYIYHYSNNLEEILDALLEYAVDTDLIEDRITTKDLLDTKLMNNLLDRPSNIINKFIAQYRHSPKQATDWFYKLNKASNYIREFRIQKDVRYKYDSVYGNLDITINLSKPEKDPKAIANALKVKATKYPKCLLCIENLGYAGREDHPARQNIRMIPLNLSSEKYYMQYSPYSYYNEHCIVFNATHKPMVINKEAFEHLIDFIDVFPHYMIGSNADLPIVGGSILTHDHYQGGRYNFPMFDAKAVGEFYSIPGYENCKVAMLYWPLSTIRIYSQDREELINLSDHILHSWIDYSDEEVNIISHTDGVRHNTITPIAHKHDGYYVMDLVLRNNRTDSEYPAGIFHVHPQYWNIKKENIGLIEVMGLAVLPSRLKKELETLIDCLVNTEHITKYPELEKHRLFVEELERNGLDTSSRKAVSDAVYHLAGRYFEKGLENCGVFKQTDEGREHFAKFIKSL